MARNPVVITSVEEDFRRIGILSESKEEKEETGDEEERLEGRRVRLQVRADTGKARRLRTKRTSPADKVKSRQYKRSHKSAIRKQRNLARNRRRKARRDKLRKRLKRESMNRLDRVASLIESVRETVVAEHPGAAMAEAKKAFANIAVIAEHLSDTFADMAEEGRDKDLAKAALDFARLAEEAAEFATKLHQGTLAEEEQDGLEETFKAHMDALLAGLDVYADLTEGCEDEEDEEEDEEDEEEGEK